MSGILVRDERDPLFGYSRESLLSLLKEKLKGRVDSAWIVGGFATGTLKPSSDVDLILVKIPHVLFWKGAARFLIFLILLGN